MEALKAHLHDNSQVSWQQDIALEEWGGLFNLAMRQKVLSMIYEATYGCTAFLPHAGMLQQMGLKQQVMMSVFNQTIMTKEFLELYQELNTQGIHPIVVKGILCRDIFPMPDHRPSGDEDIIVLPDEWNACQKTLKDLGMVLTSNHENDAVESSEELAYGRKGSPIYIEAHNGLFVSSSEAYGELNELFAGYEERTMEVEIQGVKIRSLSYTDHFAYLVLHAFKHFLHSGFGIRQVCDVILYGLTYKDEIDWDNAMELLSKARADQFTLAMFAIGEKYLDFDMDSIPLPDSYQAMDVDPDPMLDDLLSGGIYGATDAARQHSSNITLSAVIESKKGKKSSKASGVIASVFRPLSYMKKGYPFLEKAPYLLPLAWILRVKDYLKRNEDSTQSVTDSMKIGNERVELLREYDIID